MPLLHDSASFLALPDSLPLFDVRSPSEFAHGHIPGALNLPLFSDAERAAVGTAHAKNGTESAIDLGLTLIGSQLADKLTLARQMARGCREIRLHCWRGGMRSQSMAWLLETGGFRVHLLQGGYKAYRAQVQTDLRQPRPLLVLGGMTGCGKTEILLAMREQGGQVIDLEGLANHRGSAFGGIGLGAQPSNEQMENSLHTLWIHLDLSRPVWLEDESQRIGTVNLGADFFQHIEQGKLVEVALPAEQRISRLQKLYTSGNCTEELLLCLERLQKRLGRETCLRCQQAVREGAYREAIAGILGYYDKAYGRQIAYREKNLVLRLPVQDTPQQTAGLLLKREQELMSA